MQQRKKKERRELRRKKAAEKVKQEAKIAADQAEAEKKEVCVAVF